VVGLNGGRILRGTGIASRAEKMLATSIAELAKMRGAFRAHRYF